jgi:hypothetical protein
MVLTSGDALSALVDAEGLGVAVPAGDVDALAAALERLLTEGLPAARFGAVAKRFEWAVVAGPLVAWCAAPRRAPDRGAAQASATDLAAPGGGVPVAGAPVAARTPPSPGRRPGTDRPGAGRKMAKAIKGRAARWLHSAHHRT